MGYRTHPHAFAPLPRALHPTLSQSLICDLFISRNEQFWGSEHSPSHYWGYCRETRAWHKCRECAGYMTDDWAADRCHRPFEDFLPEVHRDIHRVIQPLLETATPAEQRRVGSFAFAHGVVRMLEYDPRIIIERRELHNPPRPIREEELREARQEKLYG